MDIKVIVATHKNYAMPRDNMYIPLHVGKEGKADLGYIGDNTGDNISSMNPNFCELTGMYWAWKNLDADYIGLVHYRRHFALNKNLDNVFDNVLTSNEAEKLLKKADVILPKKRKYYIETLYSHYKHTMYVEPLDETRKVISLYYPEYLKYFDKLKKRTSGHMFNMFIMKKELFDDYCKWLFNILFELESWMKNYHYDDFHSRFYGRISELLLDVYLQKNKIKYKEVDFMYMEKIDWSNKIKSFLKAKFWGEKYEKSF